MAFWFFECTAQQISGLQNVAGCRHLSKPPTGLHAYYITCFILIHPLMQTYWFILLWFQYGLCQLINLIIKTFSIFTVYNMIFNIVPNITSSQYVLYNTAPHFKRLVTVLRYTSWLVLSNHMTRRNDSDAVNVCLTTSYSEKLWDSESVTTFC